MTPAIKENEDAVDVESYVQGTMHPEAALKELGFINRGEDAAKVFWLRRLGRGFWESVTIEKANGNVVYRKLKRHGRGWDGEFTVHDYDTHATMNDIRRKVLKWKHEDAQEVIHRLLDSDPDAFDPRAELDRLVPNKCPECGSSNVSDEADDEGLLDCMNCGIWFNPLHAANAPNVPGNYPEPKEYARLHLRGHGDAQQESIEDDIEEFKARLNNLPGPPEPCIRISFSRTTPESAEAGDTSDSGWENEEGEPIELDKYDIEDGLTLADIAAKFLKDEGASVSFASASHFHPGVWYSTEPSIIDYGTGEREERNFHLAGFTAEQEKAVWDKMHERNRPAVWQ